MKYGIACAALGLFLVTPFAAYAGSSSHEVIGKKVAAATGHGTEPAAAGTGMTH